MQVIWMKSISGMIGMTVVSFSVVMATFLAGLSLGSILLSSLLTRWPPFLLLALIECGIGGLVIGFPFLMEPLDALYSAYAPASETLPHIGFRSMISAVFLLPVTTLIGAVFPLLSAIGASTGSQGTFPPKQDAQQPGMFYFVGLCGSALGAMIALVMIPAFGLSWSSVTVGAIHIIIALCALACHKRFRLPCPLTQQDQGTELPDSQMSIRSGKCLAALIGFEIMALELIGMAYMGLIVNTTVYAEATVLAAVLLSMAAGGMLYRRLRRKIATLALIGTCLLISVLGQIALLVWAKDLAFTFDQLLREGAALHQWVQGSIARFSLVTGVLAAVAIGLPAMAYSIAFSCLCEHHVNRLAGTSADIAPVSHSVGSLYAWHNCGGAVGVLVTWLILLPLLGLTLSFLLVTGFLLIGFLLLPFLGAERPPRVQWAFPAFSFATGLCVLLWVAPSADLSYSHSAAGEGQAVLFHASEGLGLVEVIEDRTTGGKRLLTNRLRQEGGGGPDDIRIQRIQGYIPILLHPKPTDVLVIGLGTGVALSAALRDEVKQVTAVEISTGIISAARMHFGEANGHILDHPKVRLVQQDGRNFIKLSRGRYDLIVQELFFPYHSGVGSLYTREHYARCKDRLSPDGMMVQWISIKQLTAEDLRTLIRTFLDVFPYTTLWLNGDYLAIIGGLKPATLDLQSFLTRYAQLDSLGGPTGVVPDPYDFLSMYMGNDRALRGWAEGSPLNTDDNLLLEYRIPLSFSTLNSVGLGVQTLSALLPLYRPLIEFVPTDNLTHLKRFADARQIFESILKASPASIKEQFHLANTLANLGAYTKAARHYEIVLRLDPDHEDAQVKLAEVTRLLQRTIPTRQ